MRMQTSPRSPRCRPGTPLLAALAGALLAAAAPAQIFTDVPRDHWAADEAAWLRERGLLEGWGGQLHGSRGFTRYEMVKVLYRFMQEADRHRGAIEGRLDALEDADRRIEEKVEALFETAGNRTLATPEALQRYRDSQARRRGEPEALTPEDEGVVQRLHALHEKVRAMREEGVTSPMLVIPPGSLAWVSLPDILLDDRPARFEEGAHVLHFGSRVQVPAGGAASVLYPGGRGGYLLLEGAAGVVRPRGFDRQEGEVQVVPGTDGARPPVLD